MAARTRNRNRVLVLLALLFFGPVLLAVVAYFGPWRWSPDTAHGDLVDPPRSWPMTAALGAGAGAGSARWSLIYARLEPCLDDCVGQLMRLEQVRLALAQDAERVQLVAYVTGPNVERAAGAGWAAMQADAAAAQPAVAAFGAATIRAGRIYIADPLANLVLSYPPDVEQRALLDDLERLLELSQIG
jgi:hypothetical protein